MRLLNLWTQTARRHEADVLAAFCPDGRALHRISWSDTSMHLSYVTRLGHWSEACTPLADWLKLFRRLRYKRPVRKIPS